MKATARWQLFADDFAKTVQMFAMLQKADADDLMRSVQDMLKEAQSNDAATAGKLPFLTDSEHDDAVSQTLDEAAAGKLPFLTDSEHDDALSQTPDELASIVSTAEGMKAGALLEAEPQKPMKIKAKRKRKKPTVQIDVKKPSSTFHSDGGNASAQVRATIVVEGEEIVEKGVSCSEDHTQSHKQGKVGEVVEFPHHGSAEASSSPKEMKIKAKRKKPVGQTEQVNAVPSGGHDFDVPEETEKQSS